MLMSLPILSTFICLSICLLGFMIEKGNGTVLSITFRLYSILFHSFLFVFEDRLIDELVN